MAPMPWVFFQGAILYVFFIFLNMRNSQRIPQNCSIVEKILFQLANFYVPQSISSFIEQHGINMTAGDEVLKKLWSTEGGA